jgi:hypothetical protein
LFHHVKEDIERLFFLNKGDPTVISGHVDYLLEGDRFNCHLKGFEVYFKNLFYCSAMYGEEYF